MAVDLSVYLVTDSARCAAAGRTVAETVRAAVAGGVTAVQVREKGDRAADFLSTVLSVAAELPAEVALIVNDRVDVFLAARSAGARVSGVHVGQSDLPVSVVRGLVGPDAVIGVSAATEDQLADAAADPARVHHVGIGALHATPTKSDAPEPLGHEGLAVLTARSELPVVAIGGITVDDVPRLRTAGVSGVAVVSAVCAAPDPTAAAQALSRTWAEAR